MSRNSLGKRFFNNLLIIEITAVLIFIFLGAIVFSYIENHTFFDSLYFTISTMSTVGFGDIIPHTTLGKVFVIIYSLTGVPLFVSMSGIILENRFNRTVKQHVTKFYKEIQEAEEEIQEMGQKINDEISDVMQETQNNQQEIHSTQKKVSETHQKVRETQQNVLNTEKKIQKIEKVIENELLRSQPRWKFFVKK